MDECGQKPGNQPIYQIRVRGILPPHWSDWLDGMTVQQDAGGNTILTGPVVDQAALFGLLDKIRDFGLTLLSVARSDR